MSAEIIEDFSSFEAGSLHFSMSGITDTMIALALNTATPAIDKQLSLLRIKLIMPNPFSLI
jgi:hypothetical protein